MKNLTKQIVGTAAGLAALASVVSPVGADMPRTQTVWSALGEGGVNAIPYVGLDKNYLWVDFEDKNKFAGVDYVYYNLNYTREGDVKGGVEGSFIPGVSEYTGWFNNIPYFRKQVLFGACSKGVCIYHDKVKGVKITVNTKMKAGGKIDQYTMVLSIPDDQLKK